MVGFETGSLVILDSSDLTKLFERQIFNYGDSVQQITFDPTNLVIASSYSGEVISISLVEHKVKYTYLDMG